MPRKGPAPKRPVVIDPVYSSPLVTQLINKILLDGKRSTAERIVYGALAGAGERAVDDALGGGALAVEEDLVDELGDQRRAVDRVDDDRALGCGALTWHYFFSLLAP